MDIYHINQLEMQRVDFQREKQFSLNIKCFARARKYHLQLKKMERKILNEQIQL